MFIHTHPAGWSQQENSIELTHAVFKELVKLLIVLHKTVTIATQTMLKNVTIQ